jgi:hypothetical protein
MGTVIGVIDPLHQLGGAQQPLRFHHPPLAVHPLRLDPVQPQALAGQPADHDPHSLPAALYGLIAPLTSKP